MKKTLIAALAATTMLTGVAHANYEASDFVNSATSGYASAEAIRDSLNSVYDNLGGTWAGSDASGEYAELLYRIDNIGVQEAQVVTLNWTGSVLTAAGPSVSEKKFTLADVILQADAFVGDLDADLFGGNSSTIIGGAVITPIATPGLATVKLDTIIAAVTQVNADLIDVDMTTLQKNEKLATFWSSIEGELNSFNSAVAALEAITDGVASVTTEAGFSDYALGGTTSSVDEVLENMFTDSAGNNYDSYIDYVNGTVALPEFTSVLFASAFSQNVTVTGNEESVSLWWNAINTPWGTQPNIRINVPAGTVINGVAQPEDKDIFIVNNGSSYVSGLESISPVGVTSRDFIIGTHASLQHAINQVEILLGYQSE